MVYLAEMKNKKIAIIDYQMSNMFSIRNAIGKIGYQTKVVSDPSKLSGYDVAILPGVGAYPEAVRHLKSLGLFESIIEFIKSGKSFIGICLGLQLLFSKSLEFEDTNGLNVISGNVLKFSHDKVKNIPHVGWNSIDILHDSIIKNKIFNKIENKSYMYFIHSMYVLPEDKNVICATTNYGNMQFTSSILKDNIFGTQFHPEKSGQMGLRLLNNFLKE